MGSNPAQGNSSCFPFTTINQLINGMGFISSFYGIYIYIHPFSKTLQFQSIYDIYIYIYIYAFCFLIRKVLTEKNNRRPFLQKEITIAAVKPFKGFV